MKNYFVPHSKKKKSPKNNEIFWNSWFYICWNYIEIALGVDEILTLIVIHRPCLHEQGLTEWILIGRKQRDMELIQCKLSFWQNKDFIETQSPCRKCIKIIQHLFYHSASCTCMHVRVYPLTRKRHEPELESFI